MRWTAFPLHPETPENGRTLEELFSGRGLDIPAMVDRLRSAAAELHLPFGRRTRTYNSRRAQVMGKWAETQGRGPAFHRLVFRAYFADGLNIAQPEVLCRLAASAGLDGDAALASLEADEFRRAVDDDWRRSRELGVMAVPTFCIDGRFLTGAQPYAALKQFVANENDRSGFQPA